MSKNPIPMVRRHAAMIVTGVIVLFVGLLILRGFAGMMAERKRNQVLAAWADTLGPFEEILEAHPPREATETALRVEELAAELGIGVAPPGDLGRAHPADDARETHRAVRLPLGDWLKGRVLSSGPSAEPVPDAVASFFADHEATLGELKRLLAEGDPPRWQIRLEKPYSARLPNQGGTIDLQRLLLADALIRNDGRDEEGVRAALEASWQLNAGLRDVPDWGLQGTALRVARMQFGALRHVERLPSSWHSRIVAHDFRRSFLDALRYEAWVWMSLDDRMDADLRDGPVDALLRGVLRPYVSYSTADASDRWRLLLIRITEAGSICDTEPEKAGIDAKLGAPGWNVVGKMTTDDLSGTIRRLARYELDLELTARLIEIRARYRAGDSRWPDDLPGNVDSAACPGERWVYEVSPGGDMSLALSRDVDWGKMSGHDLPTAYAAPARMRDGSGGT